jgi:hypothetical protein
MAYKPKAYLGPPVPAFGESKIVQIDKDNDVLVIQFAAATPAASAFSVQASDGTEYFGITKNYGIQWKVRTTRPTTGLSKGEMFIAFHGSSPKICICTSTAGQTVKQVRAKTKTFGRLTA